MHARRQRDLGIGIDAPPGGRPPQDLLVFEQPHELLRVQRVAARTARDRLLHLGRQRRRAQQVGDQSRGLRRGQRPQVHPGHVARRGRPPQCPLIEFRAGRAH